MTKSKHDIIRWPWPSTSRSRPCIQT